MLDQTDNIVVYNNFVYLQAVICWFILLKQKKFNYKSSKYILYKQYITADGKWLRSVALQLLAFEASDPRSIPGVATFFFAFYSIL